MRQIDHSVKSWITTLMTSDVFQLSFRILTKANRQCQINNTNDERNNTRPTQPSMPPGLVNQYQLRLGRQRQVWFSLLAD